MGWGDRISPELRRDQEKVAAIINEYVKKNGYVYKKTSELNELVKSISFESGIFQHPDVCYNSVNEGTKKHFDTDVHLYERVRKGYYRLLGENYPYTGEVKHVVTSEVLGKWVEGKLVTWYTWDQDSEDEYKEEIDREFSEIEFDLEDIKGQDRLAITKQRVNHSIFKRRLLKRYSNKCCLCGVQGEDMLIASHIKPWSEADMDERVDVNNGLLLCPNHDWLFDKGYISFDDDGKIIISEKLNEINQILMNVDRKRSINMSEKTKAYMEYHREILLKNNR